MATLELREGSGLPWTCEGIDFRQMRLGVLDQEGEDPAECWFLLEEGDTTYEQMVTQENTYLERNTVYPSADRISIMDERDNEYWVWFRDENEEGFTFLEEYIAVFGKLIETLYPQPDVVEMYVRRKLGNMALDLAEVFKPKGDTPN